MKSAEANMLLGKYNLMLEFGSEKLNGLYAHQAGAVLDECKNKD